MCAIQNGSTFRYVVDVVDEDNALAREALDHRPVVNDFVINVDGSAEDVQGAVQAINGHVDARAETARIGQDNLHGNLLPGCPYPSEVFAGRQASLPKAATPPGGVALCIIADNFASEA